MSLPVRMLVAYDGTGFSGFQVQPAAPTVQGEIEAALERVYGQAVRIYGAGRTDAGVHATGQVVSFDAPSDLDLERVQRSVNGQLAPSVSVLDIASGPEGFHARHSARTRAYTYLLYNHEAPQPLLDRIAVWEPRALDVDAFDAAMRAMVGHHDFSSFARVRDDQDPERTVLSAGASSSGAIVRCSIEAVSFLHQMVRSIVGSALEVAVGRRPVEWMSEVLARRDRAAAGQMMRPHGLTLSDVVYVDASWPGRPAPTWPWVSEAAVAA